MSQICMLTSKRPISGMNVSHSHVRTLRRLVPNLHHHRFFVPSENRWVRLRVTANAMRTIDKIGIDEALKRIRANGWDV